MSQRKSSNTSNRTPSARPAGTESALKLVLLITAIIAGAFLLRSAVPHDRSPECQEVVTESEEVNIAGDDQRRMRIQADIASDPESIVEGLSGRDCLGEDEGMLFLFADPGRHCFWMKGMKFDLDMIWMNSDKEIIHVEREVKPDSYPISFCPPSDAGYVLELNAGKSAEYGLAPGVRLEF